MPDVWTAVAALDAATQERLADVLETRGVDPPQLAMQRDFLGDVPFPAGARVLAEARCRVMSGTYVGHVAYGSLVGRAPP